MRTILAGVLVCCLLSACKPPPTVDSPPTSTSDPLTGRVKSVRFSIGGAYLAMATADAVAVWDLATRTQRWKGELLPAPSPVRRPQLFFRQADSQLVVVEASGRILVHDTALGTQLQNIEPQLYEDIAGADLDVSGTTLVMAGERSGRVYVIDLSATSAARVVQIFHLPPEDTATDVRIDAPAGMVAATTRGGLLAVWRWPGDAAQLTLRRIGVPDQRYRALNGLASANGTLVTVGYYAAEYGDFQIWDGKTLQVVGHFSGADPGTTLDVVLDPRARLAVTRGDLTYVLWQLTDGKLQPQLRVLCSADGSPEESADLSADAEQAALACGSGAVLIDTRTHQLLGTLNVTGKLPTLLPLDR